jgi:uncharacterized membrane protein YkoI
MKAIHTVLGAALLTGVITAGMAAQDADDKEPKVTMQQLPAPVQAAVNQEAKGATVKGFAIENENGKKLYEAELMVNGHAKDISFDAAGKIVSVEEETTMEQIPAAARAALEKAARNGKITLVEVVTEGGKTSYEAEITTGKTTSEFAVDATGRKVD